MNFSSENPAFSSSFMRGNIEADSPPAKIAAEGICHIPPADQRVVVEEAQANAGL
jgi:hypothetical protein